VVAEVIFNELQYELDAFGQVLAAPRSEDHGAVSPNNVIIISHRFPGAVGHRFDSAGRALVPRLLREPRPDG
jgi:hypothetical protein